MRPTFDERDAEILAARQRERDKLYECITWPTVGDVVDMPDGKVQRVTHVWNLRDSGKFDIQLTVHEDQRFYLHRGGGMEFSGTLSPSVHSSRFTLVGTAQAHAWFFHHDQVRAHNGVNCDVTVRRWKLT
jgi:hypothetical protein